MTKLQAFEKIADLVVDYQAKLKGFSRQYEAAHSDNDDTAMFSALVSGDIARLAFSSDVVRVVLLALKDTEMGCDSL